MGAIVFFLLYLFSFMSDVNMKGRRNIRHPLIQRRNKKRRSMLYPYEKYIEPTPYLKGAISKYARNGGGIYALNHPHADVYEYICYVDERTGKKDFSGGFTNKWNVFRTDDKGHPESNFTHAYLINEGKHVDIENEIKKDYE